MSTLSFLAHHFWPHESNNHKAKILHSSSLLLISLFLLTYQLFLYFIPQTGVRILGYAAQISIDEVVRLTNEKRAQAGLVPLEVNGTLAAAAKAKGVDMLAKGYWAHIAPDGTEPWKFFTDAGYKYKYAGENLARDFSNAGSAVEAWMASSTHKDNIISPKYKEIGIAVVEGNLNGVDTTIIVQLFGTRYTDTLPAVPLAKASEAKTSSVGAATKQEVLVTPVPTATPSYLVAAPVTEEKSMTFISPFNSTRGISLGVVGVLLVVLTIDTVVTSRKRIARVSGRGFAHISFLGMVLALALIMRAGRIL